LWRRGAQRGFELGIDPARPAPEPDQPDPARDRQPQLVDPDGSVAAAARLVRMGRRRGRRSRPGAAVRRALASVPRTTERGDRGHPGGRMVTDMRTQLARTATDLVERDPNVAVVLAEISGDRFGRAIEVAPDRVINVGIMEQTLIGVAAGFAMEG